ncbi:flagellar hook-associated family protein [Hyphomicrobium sp. 99]|uniref:flagellar hook-associated family protein n=1 Tax=Hyphomicrobium sp. 99 TaxID=1163419 RepID=UPI0005F85BCE|nr:flagellar hook-associated family protein [Hyphomicrobium sp. 99]
MISTSFISSSALSDETRRSIARLQSQLVDTQKELATGRHADVGVTLGATTGVSISMRQDLEQIQAIKNSNNLVSARMEASQSSLQTVATSTSSFLSALISGGSASTSPQTIIQAAQSGLQTLQDQMNTSLDGQYLFAGINSDVKPMEDFLGTPPSTGQQAVTSAFTAKFGFAPTDPQAANISPSDMQDFLDNEFADLFSSSNWSSIWSSASDKSVSSRISRTEIANTSVTANDSNFRALTEAFTMIAGLGFANLNSGTQQVIIAKARDLTANATGGLTQVQSYLGVAQQRVTSANDQISTQIDFLTKSIDNLEQVDPAAVTTRLSDISTALQAAYSITNKLNNLTIMDYLS